MTEYVIDVEHKPDCFRSSLYVIRNITEAATPFIDTYEGENNGNPLAHVENADWKFEELLEPHKLFCSLCEGERYVALDKDDTLLALTHDNCPRSMVHHITNYREACKFCGYIGKEEYAK